jgi:hypothetical protein
MSDLNRIKQAMADGEHTDGDLEWCVDEIERLRAGCERLHGYIAEKDAEIERLRTLAKAWEESRNQRVIEHLKDKEEIERLRAALKDILHGHTTHGLDAFALNRGEYECDTCCKYIVPKMRVLRDIALAALEDSDER